jgi:uncharacterized repeat protein (TIGR03803 family)
MQFTGILSDDFMKISCLFLLILIVSTFNVNSQCSEFYGTTTSGGPHNTGTIFKTDESGNQAFVFGPTVLYEGIEPCESVIQATNGKLLGMTVLGGEFNMGVLFEWDPVTGVYTKLVDFNGAEKGSHPRGSVIQADNNLIYGMTLEGGAYNMGVIFQWDPASGVFTKIVDFNGSLGGSRPYGNLMQADNGKLYGMTCRGGTLNSGVLFEYDPVTRIYTKRVDFNGAGNGGYPYGSLMQGDNGKLYGMTSSGGTNDLGVLFEWAVNSDSIIKKVSFNGKEKGSSPRGNLIKSKNGKLYGMTFGGGINGSFGGHGSYTSFGVLFEWDPITEKYTKELDFDGDSLGAEPYGSLIQADNEKLYGMTSRGGKNDWGTIFEWDPVHGTPKKITDFGADSIGIDPRGSLCQAGNKKIYGMSSGSYNNHGILFELVIDAVTDTSIRKFSFNQPINGQSPCGTLLNAGNGKLYGMTTTGGTKNMGVIFEWDLETNTYIKKFDFDGTENGRLPYGSLYKSKNGKIYGMTSQGGTKNYGTIFEWDPLTNIFSKKIDFDDLKGKSPDGTLSEAENGKLYSTTEYGGSNNYGVLFEWDPVTNNFAKKLDFDWDQKGATPISPLLWDKGKFYGVTGNGGIHNDGLLYEWDPASNTQIILASFNEKITGDGPSSPLMKASNGKIYGTTYMGGENYRGVIFEYDPETNLLTKKFDFNNSATEGLPENPLMQASNGKLYGMVRGSEGELYELDPDSNIFSLKFRFTGPNGSRPEGGGLTEVFHNYSSDTIHVIACDSFPSPSGRYVYKSSGEYTDYLKNAAGCDSIISINLIIKECTSKTMWINACDSYISPSRKFTWTSSGVYIDTISYIIGYDIITLHLTISHSTESMLDTVACESFTSPSGRYIWNINGNYIDTIPNAAGCDSIMTIHVTVIHPNTTIISSGSGLQAVFAGGEYQWVNCLEGYLPITGAVDQSLTPLSPGSYAVIVNDQGCLDTSDCYTVEVTGLSENEAKAGMTVYPNPTSGNFTIDLGKIYPEALVTITRDDGQVIRKENVKNSRMVDMKLDEPPGVYMVTVRRDCREAVFRVVKR